MKIFISLLFIISTLNVFAQAHHDMKKDSMPANHEMEDMDMDMGDMNMDSMQMPGMSHQYSLSLPMNRNGSGTSWMPDNSPMYMAMKHGKKSMWMFHGSIFLRYNTQQLTKKTSRSASKFDAPNWMMAMYNRQVGKNGLFSFSGMLSLDVLTVGKAGYPLLFQSGESYKGQPLVDRQHPHDLFSELSVAYTQRLNAKTDVFAYFGYPGEPAISAPAFMHRISAMNDPDAPLGHHWQDATHITFGVATIGLRYDKLKLEVSKFTGREPDENRYNFDPMKFDSYSWRLSYNPVKALAVQFSQGYIKSPESLHPDENVWRYTASALYATPVKNGRFFNASAIWGMNDEGAHHKEHSALLEANWQHTKQAVYGRYEFVQKSSEELNLQSQFGEAVFDIHKLTLGTNRSLFSTGILAFTGGAQLSANLPPPSLRQLYGSLPLSAEVYIQIRPKLML